MTTTQDTLSTLLLQNIYAENKTTPYIHAISTMQMYDVFSLMITPYYYNDILGLLKSYVVDRKSVV